jgi:hypothetical protein
MNTEKQMERESDVETEVLAGNQPQCLFVHIYYLNEDRSQDATVGSQ